MGQIATKLPNGLNILIPNDCNYYKCPKNIPTFSIPRPFKIYQNWDFWFDNIPSGNPA
jgi:hypothetical protein